MLIDIFRDYFPMETDGKIHHPDGSVALSLAK